MLEIRIPDEAVAFTASRARYFAIEWRSELPFRLHKPRVIDDGGSPEFDPEFLHLLESSLADARRRSHRDDDDSPRLRVRRAFSRLRKRAPREFDVIYSICVLDEVGFNLKPGDIDGLHRQFERSLRATSTRLNHRAMRLGVPERYTENDVLILAVSAVSKLVTWAG